MWSRILLSLLLAASSAQAAAADETMAIEAYARTAHDTPYVLGLCKGRGKLLYVGILHSTDPQSPTTYTVQELWSAYTPDVVLIEGGSPPPPSPNLDEAVRSYAEAGATTFLARQHGIPVATLELPLEEEVSTVLKEFTADQVALFYALRLVAQERRRHGPDGLAAYLPARIIPWMSRISPLQGVIASEATLKSLLSKQLPELGDWRTIPAEWFDPMPQSGMRFTNAIARRLVQVRDSHMSRLVTDQVEQGHRVFAVVGASHVVMQEDRIRSVLGCAQRADKPGSYRRAPPRLACDTSCSPQ